MRSITISVFALALLGGAVHDKNEPAASAVERGARWLASTQGHDGGWGQDGGETSYVRQGQNLESKGNDVANTAVATQALLRAGSTPTSGPYRANIQKAVNFLLRSVEASPDAGLAITDVTNSQIQRKLGPFIDTFLTSHLLAELDGTMGDAQSNQRVRQALKKCVAKIEKNQQKDGSWNISGGWAPVLGTSMASRSLYAAKSKGVVVSESTMARVDQYSVDMARASEPRGVGGGVVGGVAGVRTAAAAPPPAKGDAGVVLYSNAQVLEQLSRTEKDRKKNEKEIRQIAGSFRDERVVNGFGSMGGEEFFSYLNVSDSMRRVGGPEWTKWNTDMKAKLVKLQNEDGTWAGHHCITGRVAVTSAAMLTLFVDRTPAEKN